MENPEQRLIEVLADQIADDERIIEGMGTGLLSLEDLERWRQLRWESEKRFLHETGELIAAMRKEGFGGSMRHADSESRPAPRAPKLSTKRRYRQPVQEDRKAEPAQETRYVLELADLGLPCSFRMQGSFEDVMDAGVWHARHVHKVRGTLSSLRGVIKSAMCEVPQTPEWVKCIIVSDETANSTRNALPLGVRAD